YGPYQFPEKLIPLMVLNIKNGKSLPVYGEGKNIRDWIYVEDHNRAVWQILKEGCSGEKYNIGGENEWQNIRLLEKLIELTAKETGLDRAEIESTIIHVKDRPGHDARYAIDCTKIKKELGWERRMTFEEGLLMTVKWYLSNTDWVNHVLSGEYQNWISRNYGSRK
ncbi:MAG TPA: dTDP-glucose 4,6-dehydratase, partial [Treponema sp.]|nr:dTDP-glucose 4,6-dehydratase [Treponema sp.]